MNDSNWKLCDAPDCNKYARSRGAKYCEAHYARLRNGSKYGLSPLITECLQCGEPLLRKEQRYCSRSCQTRHRRGRAKGKATRNELPLVPAEHQEWRVVPGFPDYEISNDGRLRRATDGSNSKKGKEIVSNIGATGYPKYSLSAPSGKRKTINAHRLVALTFLPSPAPEQNFVLHKNDNKLDIRACNLKWGTSSDNYVDAVNNGGIKVGYHYSHDRPWAVSRGEKHSSSKLTEDQVLNILQSDASSSELARKYGVDSALIYRIKKGLAWKHITNPDLAARLKAGEKQ